MTISTDNFSLYIALCGAGASCLAYLVLALLRGVPWDSRLSRFACGCYYVSAGAFGYASVYLFTQILSGRRYDIAYIHDYSSPTDALIYRISAFWAGQQGSLLLWALMCALIGVPLVRRFHSAGPAMLSFWASVLAFMALLLVAADPFAQLAGFEPGMIGTGLNPLLKNPWMAVHPPVIFLGYAVLAVPAAMAVHLLVKGGSAANWARTCLPWALFGWVSLSAGIILGMVWSYEVLGWGGYWGWDPVENASLVPWLTATALVHGLLVQRQRGRMGRANVLLALGTFVLIIFATFLTRSGVLSDVSVHSFSNLGTYTYLLAFLLFYLVVSTVLVAARWKSVPVSRGRLMPGSRDFALAMGCVLFVLFGLVVLAGTVFPLLSRSVLERSFYTHMSVPIAIGMLVLIAAASLSGWGRDADGGRPAKTAQTLAIPVAGVVVAAAAAGAVAAISPDAARKAFSWLAPAAHPAFRAAVPVLVLVFGLALCAGAASVSCLLRSKPFRGGAHLAHAGVALMVIGIIISATGTSDTIFLRQSGPPEQSSGYAFDYMGREMVGEGEEMMKVRAKRAGRLLDMPMLMRHTQRGSVRAPHIRSSLLGDLYVSPLEIRSTILTPTASVTDEGWVAPPLRIGGSGAVLELAGMQVEENAAKLRYTPREGQPVEFMVGSRTPSEVDGYRFEFRKLFVESSKDMGAIIAGVDIALSGGDIEPETAVIEVSTKPLMSLLWLGTLLIMLGGAAACLGRRSDAARGKDGILPDSGGSD